MSRGQKDFGMYAVKEVAASISDMGEVAARLGSIVTYDKRGDVVDFDNFESPKLRWYPTYVVADGDVYLDSTTFLSGAQAVKIVTAASATARQMILNRINVLAARRLGIEASFGYLSATAKFGLFLLYYDGTNSHGAACWINPTDGVIQLDLGGGVFQTIATRGALTSAVFYFYTMKLVVDFDTDEYVRLLFANEEYDISAYDLVTAASTASPSLDRYIQIQNLNSVASSVWVDNFVFTQAEP